MTEAAMFPLRDPQTLANPRRTTWHDVSEIAGADRSEPGSAEGSHEARSRR